jgi:hypothetical protein
MIRRRRDPRAGRQTRPTAPTAGIVGETVCLEFSDPGSTTRPKAEEAMIEEGPRYHRAAERDLDARRREPSSN